MEENKQTVLKENEPRNKLVEQNLEKSRDLLERCKQAINRAHESNERWQKQLKECTSLPSNKDPD